MRMKHDPVSSGKRKSVNLSLDPHVVEAARKVGVNLSQISEAAIRTATRAAEDVAWKNDNKEWIAAHRRWVEENELPLEKYRLF